MGAIFQWKEITYRIEKMSGPTLVLVPKAVYSSWVKAIDQFTVGWNVSSCIFLSITNSIMLGMLSEQMCRYYNPIQ